jgi:hypothetical protein
LEDAVFVDGCGNGSLDEWSKTFEDAGFQLDGFTRARGAEDLGIANRGQFQVQQGRNCWVGLGNGTSELCPRLKQQDAREKWLPGKVSGEERFVTAHPILAGAGLTGNKTRELIEEPKFGPVGKCVERREEGLVWG